MGEKIICQCFCIPSQIFCVPPRNVRYLTKRLLSLSTMHSLAKNVKVLRANAKFLGGTLKHKKRKEIPSLLYVPLRAP